LRAVVGDSPCDREPWSAIGAIQERITVTSIRGVKQLAQAVGAGRGVCRNSRAYFAVNFAGYDAEAWLVYQRQLFENHGIDAGERRSFTSQPCTKSVNAVTRAFHFDGHAICVITDETSETFLSCNAVNKGTKAHPLHHSAHLERFAASGFWLGSIAQLN
jgi:hypothetical protein